MNLAPNPDLLVDSETGIIKWVSEIPLDPGEPEIFNFSTKMCDSAKYLPVRCYDRNGGAALTREGAYRAAVGEAVERYCCSVYFHDEFLLGSHREVAEHARALTPEELALFHPEQRERIRFDWFERDTRLCWTCGYSLTRGEPVLVPACLVYIPFYPFYREQGEETIGPSMSTGLACAQSFPDAVLRGLYEVVERDAFMITWLNRLPVPRIDLDSSPHVADVFNTRFARPHLRYKLFALASDVDIAAVFCVLIDEGQDPVMICTGGAASLDPERAVLKALVEAAQTRQWAKFLGHRTDTFVIASDYSNIEDFEQHVYLYGYGDMMEPMRFLLESEAELPLSALPNRSSGESEEDLRRARAAVEARDCETIVFDLTTPDARAGGFRVAKVVVPQMQQLDGDHNHRFLGGRRLLEVPQALGYSVSPKIEDLNPYPHPYP